MANEVDESIYIRDQVTALCPTGKSDRLLPAHSFRVRWDVGRGREAVERKQARCTVRMWRGLRPGPGNLQRNTARLYDGACDARDEFVGARKQL
jgi:hypothetical protein